MVNAQKVVIVKTTDVLACRAAIARLCEQAVSVKTAQKFMELEKHTNKIAVEFGERRDKIAIKNKSTKNSKDQLKLEGEGAAAFKKEIGAVLQEEVRIPLKQCVMLAEVAEAKISAHDLKNISFLVKDLE